MDRRKLMHRERGAAVALTAALAAVVALGLPACAPPPADPAVTATAQPRPTSVSSTPSPRPTPAPVTPTAAPPLAPASSTPPAAPMLPEPAGGVAPAVDRPPAASPTPTPPEPPTPPAPLGEVVVIDTGIAVEIVSIAATEVDAHGHGAASDPALVVEVSARNDSTEPRAVDAAVVTLVADGGDHGIGTAAGDPSPLAGVLAPGESAAGRYVFLLDPAVGREVTVSIDDTAGEPVAVFTGTYS